MNIPILGKQNHEDRCKLIRIQGNSDTKQYDCIIWYTK